MPKKKKPNLEERESLIKNENTKKRRFKYEILSRITELELLAKKAALTENYDEAIKFSENIIRLAIVGDFSQHIKEQQNFLNKIALKVQKNYTIKEINEVGTGIRKIYGVLIDAEKYEEAHSILKDFEKNYHNIPYFRSLPIIQELIQKDTRLWIKYKISLDQIEIISENDLGNKFEDDLNEIKKFLKNV